MNDRMTRGWPDILTKVTALLIAAGALWQAIDGKGRTDTAYSGLYEAFTHDMDRYDDKLDRVVEQQAKLRESVASLTAALKALNPSHRGRAAEEALSDVIEPTPKDRPETSRRENARTALPAKLDNFIDRQEQVQVQIQQAN